MTRNRARFATIPVPPDMRGAVPAEMLAGGRSNTFRYHGTTFLMERVPLEEMEAHMDRHHLQVIKPRPRTGQMMWPPLVICEERRE